MAERSPPIPTRCRYAFKGNRGQYSVLTGLDPTPAEEAHHMSAVIERVFAYAAWTALL
jgi:hypothetical protein